MRINLNTEFQVLTVDQGDKLAGIVITTDLTPTSVVTRFDLFLKENALNVLETCVENDPILNNPNFENYQFVNGVDCKIYLSEFENRRELFEKKHYHICTLAS